ncbi:MAG TPA: hypothetical protein VGQ17_12630 [Gemmatimonadales bacterium]|nr:hypothetical protein [Gemmatimonadales bacterium]
MANNPLGPCALLLAALAGCGGGAAAPAKPDPAAAAAAAAEEGAAPAAKPKPQVPAEQPAARIDESLIPEPGTPLRRESYVYNGGRRDPFISILGTANIGPELPDLNLVAIVYTEGSPASSVAVLHDKITGKRYTVRQGDRLGRMRISSIRPKDVTFTIDDFGTAREETLSLRKQEVK